jgi:hypothetical protein
MSVLYTLYFLLHKNDKCVWILVCMLSNLIGLCHFYVAHDAKSFILQICMLVGYIIDYAQIYFHIFMKLVNIIFKFY